MDSGSGHLLVTWWLVFRPDSWLVDWARTVLSISPPNPHFSLFFTPLFPSPSLASYHHPSLSLPFPLTSLSLPPLSFPTPSLFQPLLLSLSPPSHPLHSLSFPFRFFFLFFSLSPPLCPFPSSSSSLCLCLSVCLTCKHHLQSKQISRCDSNNLVWPHPVYG